MTSSPSAGLVRLGLGGFGLLLGGGFGFLGRFLLEFQDGVFLKFLLDAFLQRHDRQLEDFHRLDHAGGQDHPLVHPLMHARIESHGFFSRNQELRA